MVHTVWVVILFDECFLVFYYFIFIFLKRLQKIGVNEKEFFIHAIVVVVRLTRLNRINNVGFLARRSCA